jgi:hypothetical protein
VKLGVTTEEKPLACCVAQEVHLNGAVLDSAFSRPAVLITGAAGALSGPPESRAARDQALLDAALGALRANGARPQPCANPGRLPFPGHAAHRCGVLAGHAILVLPTRDAALLNERGEAVIPSESACRKPGQEVQWPLNL